MGAIVSGQRKNVRKERERYGLITDIRELNSIDIYCRGDDIGGTTASQHLKSIR